jgi:hypothetical protein
VVQAGPDHSPAAQIAQVQLRLHYQELARRGPAALPGFGDVEFRCFSQNGEDGILLFLFALLGTESRRAVEICAGDGIECNAANLIVNHGWDGLLIDGDPASVERGREFYARCKTTWVSPPTLVVSWVTAENVNSLIRDNGFSGEVDLLSLDLDGNDYWIWQAIDSISPRVVVLEFNDACGPDASMSIRYRPDFRLDFSVQPYRCGASLSAFAKLAGDKGYRLVGVHSLGFNAFFVRADLGAEFLPERTPRECFERTERLRRWNPSNLEALVSGEPIWQEV